MTAIILCAALALLVGSWLLFRRRESHLSAALLAALLLSLGAIIGSALGQAKPVWLAFELQGRQVEVLAAWPEEPRAIYLMVRAEDGEPETIRLPWNEGAAAEAQRLLQAASDDGNVVTMRAGDGNQADPQFRLALPAPLPAKDTGQ